jgi:hypothetical protein
MIVGVMKRKLKKFGGFSLLVWRQLRFQNRLRVFATDVFICVNVLVLSHLSQDLN